jgi:hypothetical protein
MASWRDDPYGWTTLEIGTHKFPGVARLTGTLKRDLDVQKSKGNDGATIKDNGYDPTPMAVELEYLPKQHADMMRIFADLNPRGQKERTAYSIQFAPANDVGIHTVYVESLDIPTVDRGIGKTRVQLLEWVAEPKKTKAGKGTPKQAVQRTLEGPGTFVTLLNKPPVTDVIERGVTQADDDFLDFMQNAM